MSVWNKIIYQLKKRVRPLLNPKTVHFIGDSHADVFWQMEFSPLYFWKIVPKIKIVHGATATGLANPNSQTKALKIFESYIQKEIKANHYVVFQLGEVDCGFAIWYRAEKHQISVDEQLHQALSNYSKLINKTKAINGHKTIVCSAILPTIQDGQNFGQVANLRREVNASLHERTALSLRFNAALQKICTTNSLSFLNLDPHLLDQKKQILKACFLHDDPTNHHLNPKPLMKVLNTVLNKTIF